MLIVLVGNIGTGKSKYANEQKELDCNTRVICMDEIFDIYNDLEKTTKYVSSVIEFELGAGRNIIVDGKNLDHLTRGFFLSFAKSRIIYTKIIDFGKGDEISLQRRIENSPEKSAEEWEKLHSENQQSYETPSLDEGCNEICVR